MTTKNNNNRLSLEGQIYWAHNLFVPDEYRGNKEWKIKVALDDDQMKVFKAAKTRIQVRQENFTDKPVVLFRRPTEKTFATGTVEFEPPKVVNTDGTNFEERIGNGTKARVEASLYPCSDGSGEFVCRLEKVIILELVSYDNPEGQERTAVVEKTSSDSELKAPAF